MTSESQISADHPGAPIMPAPPEALPEQAAPEPVTGSVAPIWLQRLSLFVLVLFCVYLGVLVMLPQACPGVRVCPPSFCTVAGMEST
jgi:hypothetical protein